MTLSNLARFNPAYPRRHSGHGHARTLRGMAIWCPKKLRDVIRYVCHTASINVAKCYGSRASMLAVEE